MNKFKLSYDGKGINVSSLEYSPRVLTFVQGGSSLGGTDLDKLGYLVAAAPDMLTVLYALVGAPPEFGENGMCKFTTQEVILMARAAIAKAEGSAKK